jgi:hypothetical protein
VKPRTTQLLSVLLIVAAVAAVISLVQLREARGDALDRLEDLRLVRADLADLAHARIGGGISPSAGSSDPALTRRLRSAATAAGVADQLSSIEPGQPSRLPDTDYMETPVFVRLDAATLQSLVTMLSDLSADERAIAVRSIELSPPASPKPSEETWTADLTFAYVTYSPRH